MRSAPWVVSPSHGVGRLWLLAIVAATSTYRRGLVIAFPLAPCGTAVHGWAAVPSRLRVADGDLAA
jgi:hypothetical protein